MPGAFPSKINLPNVVHQMERFKILWTCLTSPSGKEPTESTCKEEAKLGQGLDKPSVYHDQADLSNLLLLVLASSLWLLISALRYLQK